MLSVVAAMSRDVIALLRLFFQKRSFLRKFIFVHYRSSVMLTHSTLCWKQRCAVGIGLPCHSVRTSQRTARDIEGPILEARCGRRNMFSEKLRRSDRAQVVRPLPPSVAQTKDNHRGTNLCCRGNVPRFPRGIPSVYESKWLCEAGPGPPSRYSIT
jgi:hypothetical protein